MRATVIFFFLFALPSFSTASTFEQKRSYYGYDFLVFVLQWPGSRCNTNEECCFPGNKKPIVDFHIHGVWPNYKNGEYPTDCSQESFNASKISKLISALEVYWPSLNCPSDSQKFWAHEWEKHGTCATPNLSDEERYFKAALYLNNKVNILKTLKKSGIHPGKKFYALKEIKNAIKKRIGYTPAIACNRDKSENVQLYQVYLCVNQAGTDFIACPVLPSKGEDCSKNIKFPSF